MKKVKKHIKIYYYQAKIKIDITALLELLNKEILFEERDIVKVFQVYDVTYITTTRSDLMKEVENLYPNVFQPCETIILEGNILFST